MPFVPVENTALVEIRMSLEGEFVENTLWVLNDSAWDGDSLLGLCSNIKDWWEGTQAPLLHVTLILREISATDMTTSTSGQVVIPGDGLNGDVTGDSLPNAMAATISFHTAMRGRSFRGRNYITGLPNTVRDDSNTINSTFSAAEIAAYTGLITAALGPGQTWVVASRFSGIDPTTHKPIPRTAGVTTPVTTVTFTDLNLDTQRRRGRGRGV